jgi:activating signal cointegrator 1
MKAITICQPYAELIARGEKLIENRTWPTSIRGRIAIHAGKSREWMSEDDEQRYPGMAFGAIVAYAYLYNCLRLEDVPLDLQNEHANGPWCFLLRNVVRVECPIPARGAQGFWDWRE